MNLENLCLFLEGVGRHVGGGGLSWERHRVPFVCKPDELTGHLCCLDAQYMLFLTDCRVEVIVGIAFKPILSKSSISSGLAPAL